MDERVKRAFDLGKCIDLQNRRLMLLGFGCIGSTFLPLLLRHSNIKRSNLLIIDKNREVLNKVPSGIPTKNIEIKKKNFRKEILDFLGAGDILVDLAYYIKTTELLKLCNENQIFFINTAVELWSEEECLVTDDPRKLTLYERQMKLQEAIADFKNKTTNIITHGANPGWVSHFVKEALVDMVGYLAKQGKLSESKLRQLVEWIEDEDFPSVAKELDVQVIHISERDSQFAKSPKEPKVFRNTWSPTGFVEEGTAPAELGWGTHENPEIGYHYKTGPKNQIALSSRGINTWVKTWVPSGPLIGMIVRHEEAFSISKYLTKDNYRPTVHYAYLPCPDSVYSLNEIQNEIMIHNKIPEFKEEILNDQIVEGKDELGVLLFAKDITWWRGSLLDIVEARKLLPHQSATSVQVGISVLAGIHYMLKNPEEGVIHPEGMHHLDVLSMIEAYLGPVASIPVEWSPLDSVAVYQKMDLKNRYRFENFIVSYNN